MLGIYYKALPLFLNQRSAFIPRYPAPERDTGPGPAMETAPSSGQVRLPVSGPGTAPHSDPGILILSAGSDQDTEACGQAGAHLAP